MKAEELMIGDWVIVYEKAMPVKARVDGVYGNNAFVLGHPRIVENGFVDPIPLTPAILEKNGFREKNIFAETMGFEIFGDENNGCGISFWYDGDWAFETFTPWTETAPDGSPEDWGFRTETRISRIKYVHQMQHALRLCGIEKEIML